MLAILAKDALSSCKLERKDIFKITEKKIKRKNTGRIVIVETLFEIKNK